MATMIKSLKVSCLFLVLIGAVIIASLPVYGGTDAQGNEYVDGEVLVKFKSSTLPVTMEQLNKELGADIAQTFPGDPNLFLLKLSDGTTVEKAIEFYNRNAGAVEYAEPSYIYHLVDTIPDDPRFSSQYALLRINAPAAWDYTVGDYSVIVADNDTGVDMNHVDLVDNFWPGVGAEFLSGTFGPPTDDNGHGTHTAGTIAATGNNGIGVAGVMWAAQLMALKICTGGGACSLTAAIRAIDFGVANGAWVSNNSWGGGGRSQALQDAINRANQAGVLFVVAAGDSNRNNDTVPFYPCNYGVQGSPNVICVASTTSADTRSSFSNYGRNSVHLAAPGSSILSTCRGNNYCNLSGTSMAAPHVTGAVGLVWSLNPNLTHLEVKDLILNNVRPVASLQSILITGGILNVGAAVASTPAP